jgi:hypothetical protein
MIDDFKARFPEFATATVDTYLPILEPVWPSYYGRDYDANQEAVLNLVAHLIVMETASGSGNVKSVASVSVGSVSTAYSAATQTGGERYDFFRTSKYGTRFLRLTMARHGGVAV